jgi:hypothetical protein
VSAERTTPRLHLAPYRFGAALALERELGVSHTLAQVLVRRGLGEPADARRFLPRTHGTTRSAAEEWTRRSR